MREQLGVAGMVGKIENRILTVVTGTDMVNITFLNFMAFQDEVAKVSITTGTHVNTNKCIYHYYYLYVLLFRLFSTCLSAQLKASTECDIDFTIKMLQ